MLLGSYALFLFLILCASARVGSGWAPRREGSPWRLAGIAVSLACLALFLMLLPGHHGITSVGMLIAFAGLGGAAAYGIGVAIWVGDAARLLREAGWVGLALAFGIPTTLSLALPVVGVLAFTLAPISRYASNEPTARGAAA